VPRELSTFLFLLVVAPATHTLYNHIKTSPFPANYSYFRHRDASQHACPVPEPVAAPKNEAAHALLAKHFSGATATATTAKASTNRPASAPSKRKVPTTDPKKLAQLQKVELMKMRHRAVPADPRDKPGSIGIDQRLHVRVSYESDPEGVQKIFWFRKVSRLDAAHLYFYPLKSLQTK
jgi:hypothetical protein